MSGKKDSFFTLYGGAGKSSLVAELSLTLDRQVITNQSIASPLPLVLNEENLLILDDPTQEMPDLPEETDIIFDLAGHPDHRVISSLRQSNHVFIPAAGNTNRVNGLLETIVETIKYNKNIVIIVTPTESETEEEDCSLVREAIIDNLGEEYRETPIYPIRFSKGIPNIFNTGKSIHQTAKESKLMAYSYREIIKQLDEILNIIK